MYIICACTVHNTKYLSVCSFQNDSMPILASFLRKNQRALKLSTLNTLNVLMNNYGKIIMVLLANIHELPWCTICLVNHLIATCSLGIYYIFCN